LALLNDTAGQTQLIASRAQWVQPADLRRQSALHGPLLLAGMRKRLRLRGKLISSYIDPPFDSKADYPDENHAAGGDVEQKPTVIEQFAYSDTWRRHGELFWR